MIKEYWGARLFDFAGNGTDPEESPQNFLAGQLDILSGLHESGSLVVARQTNTRDSCRSYDSYTRHFSKHSPLPTLHRKRLNALMSCVSALLYRRRLTLTDLGRFMPSRAYTEHSIKRLDRVLGHVQLQHERPPFYWKMLTSLPEQQHQAETGALTLVSRPRILEMLHHRIVLLEIGGYGAIAAR